MGVDNKIVIPGWQLESLYTSAGQNIYPMKIVYPSTIREFLRKNNYPWQNVVPGETFILQLERNI